MRALKDGGIPLEVYREGDASAGAVEWGNLVMGRTAGGIFVPLQLLADGSVTATVGGTVTADQGDAGVQAWLTRSAPPGVPTVFLDAALLDGGTAWTPTPAVEATVLNAAGTAGYDGARIGLNITADPAGAGSIVEVRVQRSSDGVNWQDIEEAIDYSGAPLGGILLVPANAQQREYTLAAGATAVGTWEVSLRGSYFYRAQAREQLVTANPATVTLTGVQFKF